ERAGQRRGGDRRDVHGADGRCRRTAASIHRRQRVGCEEPRYLSAPTAEAQRTRAYAETPEETLRRLCETLRLCGVLEAGLPPLVKLHYAFRHRDDLFSQIRRIQDLDLRSVAQSVLDRHFFDVEPNGDFAPTVFAWLRRMLDACEAPSDSEERQRGG